MGTKKRSAALLSTGIAGLDYILMGGLIPQRAYLVRGGPGSGKTTLGLHFLTSAAPGEASLFISLTEPVDQIRSNAEKMGFDLQQVHFLDLSPSPQFFAEVETYDIFSPAEVERAPITQKITQAVEEIKPSRVFVDSMTHFRYLTSDPFQFRQQVLSFIRYLVERGATVLFTSESSAEAPDDDLQFLADGIIQLEHHRQGRSLDILKLRGSSFRRGAHSLLIDQNGISVFPQLVPEEEMPSFQGEIISSGVAELDELLGGGLERGTVTLISGPSGVGKTTLGLQFMKEAARCGERSVVYSFEEEIAIMLHRCDSISMPARSMIEKGTLEIVKIEPLQYTPAQFAQRVRHDIEHKHTRIVMIDSLAGYSLSLSGQDLRAHLHALTKYLQSMGIVVLLIIETRHVTGDFLVTESDVSYLGDNIIFLRYLELDGEIRKAIGVLKKRMSDFEHTLREIEITSSGLKIGKPLSNLRHILSGQPEWVNNPTRE